MSLRIFYAADHEPIPGVNLWHDNLFLSLVDLGHDVVSFDYDLTPHFKNANGSDPAQAAFIEEHRGRLEDALLRQIEAEHRAHRVDVFFSYFYSAFCRPQIIREIRALGICTMNWYCNASYQFELVRDIAPAYDYCLVPEKFRLDDYRRAGANPLYCQEAANPNIYKPYPVEQEFDVTFVGQKYGDRPDYIAFLLDAGIDVRVWGQGWQAGESSAPEPGRWRQRFRRLQTIDGWRGVGARIRRAIAKPAEHAQVAIPPSICGPPLSLEELVRMYSRSKISMGFSVVGEKHETDVPIRQVRLRDFEAPMSGAFYMVEQMEELEEFFEPGKEIVFYHDRQDLADKARFYLAHTEDRERIRRAGHARARRDHSWQKRLSDVFKTVGLVV